MYEFNKILHPCIVFYYIPCDDVVVCRISPSSPWPTVAGSCVRSLPLLCMHGRTGRPNNNGKIAMKVYARAYVCSVYLFFTWRQRMSTPAPMHESMNTNVAEFPLLNEILLPLILRRAFTSARAHLRIHRVQIAACTPWLFYFPIVW